MMGYSGYCGTHKLYIFSGRIYKYAFKGLERSMLTVAKNLFIMMAIYISLMKLIEIQEYYQN